LAAHLSQLPATDLTTLEAAVAIVHKLLTLEPVEDTAR
jgi:hypothetical protein